MKADARLISSPTFDFNTFLGLASNMLGYSLSQSSDASHKKLSDTEKFLSCLAALRDPNAPAGLPSGLLSHASFSALVAAEEEDMLDILQCCSGMSFIQVETETCHVRLAVITGTLAQWKEAIKMGNAPVVVPSARACFNKLYSLFELASLNIWTDSQPQSDRDQTFYLEDRRNR
jgi:hypothetical protein